MPAITKIYVQPIGEFTIKFSLRKKRFEIDYPNVDGLTDAITERNKDLHTFADVEKELESIKDQFLYKTALLRKVIIITIKSSETDKPDPDEKGINYGRDGHLSDCIGFQLKWYVAEELRYSAKTIKYKITETFDNAWRVPDVNILPQLFYGKAPMVFDYSPELHEWLKNLDVQMAQMLSRLNDFFAADQEKFLQNIRSSGLKFLK